MSTSSPHHMSSLLLKQNVLLCSHNVPFRYNVPYCIVKILNWFFPTSIDFWKIYLKNELHKLRGTPLASPPPPPIISVIGGSVWLSRLWCRACDWKLASSSRLVSLLGPEQYPSPPNCSKDRLILLSQKSMPLWVKLFPKKANCKSLSFRLQFLPSRIVSVQLSINSNPNDSRQPVKYFS